MEEKNKKISRLLSCPFCGKDVFEGRTINSQYIAKCFNCGVVMTQDRKDKLETLWNQRKNQTKTTE